MFYAKQKSGVWVYYRVVDKKLRSFHIARAFPLLKVSISSFTINNLSSIETLLRAL